MRKKERLNRYVDAMLEGGRAGWATWRLETTLPVWQSGWNMRASLRFLSLDVGLWEWPKVGAIAPFGPVAEICRNMVPTALFPMPHEASLGSVTIRAVLQWTLRKKSVRAVYAGEASVGSVVPRPCARWVALVKGPRVVMWGWIEAKEEPWAWKSVEYTMEPRIADDSVVWGAGLSVFGTERSLYEAIPELRPLAAAAVLGGGAK